MVNLYIAWDENGYITHVGVTKPERVPHLEKKHNAKISLHDVADPVKERVKLAKALKYRSTKAFKELLGYVPLLITQIDEAPSGNRVKALFGKSDVNYFVDFEYDIVTGWVPVKSV